MNADPTPTSYNVLSCFSPMRQLDGIDDLHPHQDLQPVPDYQPVLPGPSVTAIASRLNTFARPTATARKASFSLDKNKQIKKLRKDSVVSNFEIEFSPGNENVNIHCSVGFYTKGAIPTFEHLSAGVTTTIGDVIVKCHDVTKRTDATGAATSTVIMYRLYQNKLSVGQVTVHLHNTTRNVQVQGSALLPDNTKAPVWFVENILKVKFNQLSESQAKEISSFNRSVGEMVTKHLEQTTRSYCAGCQANFNGRSSPEQCPECKQHYHKKCFPAPNHSCQVRKRTMSCSNRSEAQSSLLKSKPTAIPSWRTQPLSMTALTGSPAPVPTDPSRAPPPSLPTVDASPTVAISRSPLSVISSSSQIAGPSHHTTPALSDPRLDPDALPFSSCSNVENTAGPSNDKVKGKQKGKTKCNKTSGDLSLEYAQYEINVTQAKLREQETTIKDLRFKNNLLESRVADLEKKQKQDIYDRYFPKAQASPASDQGNNTQADYGSCCCNKTSHLVVSCCRSQQQRPCQNQQSAFIPEEVGNKLDDIKQDMKNLKCRLDILSDVTIPQKIREAIKQDNITMPSTPRSNITSSPASPFPASTLTVEAGQEPVNDSNTTIDEAIHDLSSDNLN